MTSAILVTPCTPKIYNYFVLVFFSRGWYNVSHCDRRTYTSPREKIMETFQLSMFYNYHGILAVSEFYREYDALFSALDLTGFPCANAGRGRPGYSPRAMLRAFIVGHRERKKTVPDLIKFLDTQPMLTEMCGFEAGALPDESQFSRFLTDTPNSTIQRLHLGANRKLIDNKVIKLDQFVPDSKPVKAATRHNNPKNPSRSRNKNKKIRRNPDATLGYYSYVEQADGTKRTEFFWGYRTHVIVSKEGICLVEITLRNNVRDADVVKRLIRKLKKLYCFKKGVIFLADAAYDERSIYDLIVTEMKAQAFIRLNPRHTEKSKTLGPHDRPLCDAGLEMSFCGNSKDDERLRLRLKYRCPLKTRAGRHELGDKLPATCPAANPRFSEGAAYGCTKYLDVTDDPRHRLDRSSPLFQEKIKERQTVEQYFSRLGDREAEQTTHYRLRSVKNQMTIAHLTLSLVALAAVQLGRPESIRCYKTFAKAG